MNTKIILTTPPESFTAASKYCETLGHMAYQIGEDFHLYRTNIPVSLKGGLMVLGDKTYTKSGDPEVLTTEITRECVHRGFSGVIADFDSTSNNVLHTLISMLSERLKKQDGELFLTENYAVDSDWSKIMISTAISGGSLATRLHEVASKYGRERLCLDIERIRMDFCLPSRNGNGTVLSEDELEGLVKSYHPQPYFSQDLCAYYFTFNDDNGSHFVLYDDAGSIRKKLQLASRLGVTAAMLLYPEVEDIIGNL